MFRCDQTDSESINQHLATLIRLDNTCAYNDTDLTCPQLWEIQLHDYLLCSLVDKMTHRNGFWLKSLTTVMTW